MATTKSLDQIINETAKKFTKLFQSRMPVRTGRLRKGIKYEVQKRTTPDGTEYSVIILAEDYLKWLRERKNPLPTNILRWTGVIDTLPEMNNLGFVNKTQLSPRSQGLLRGLDFELMLPKDEITRFYELEITNLIESELEL